MPNQNDMTADARAEPDRPAEGVGEIDEARFKAAPDEVRSAADAALSQAFPEPENKH